MNNQRLCALIAKHEGSKKYPYSDATGQRIILDRGKITIGIGRNLSDKGLSEDEILYLLSNDVKEAHDHLISALPFYNNLDEVRQAVLLDMAFNMGTEGLCKFNEFLGLVKAGNYEAAAADMLHTHWAVQVENRALEDSQMMLTGEWPDGI